MPPPRVSAVLQSLSEHSLSLPDFLLYILLAKESLFEPQQAQLVSQIWEIFNAWSCPPSSSPTPMVSSSGESHLYRPSQTPHTFRGGLSIQCDQCFNDPNRKLFNEYLGVVLPWRDTGVTPPQNRVDAAPNGMTPLRTELMVWRGLEAGVTLQRRWSKDMLGSQPLCYEKGAKGTN
ncbi:hypothetical protein M422DRAFT_23733 [Sphaerobolus stellatus SS14]|nr:hypothetical protein M422DRAFT_23733 [Sphaerobolus stellatus SS14]